MPRSEFQSGPATDHYHDTLGVDETPVADVQTIRLLGPFEFVREADDIEKYDTGITVPAGSLVIKAFAVFAEDPESNGAGTLTLTLAEPDEPGLALGVAIYDMFNGYPDTTHAFVQPEGGDLADTEEVHRSARVLSDASLFVQGQGDWSGGRMDIYALIAEPS